MKQLTFIALLALSFLSFGKESTLYISKGGNDQNHGSKEKPFATLERAKSYITEKKLATKGNITVYLNEGSYYQSSPLRFSAENAGTDKNTITFKALAGQKVHIKGSTPIANNAWKHYKDGIYSTSLKGTVFEKEKITQLYLNNKRMVLARYPNWDYENPIRGGKGYLICKNGGLDHLEWRAQDLNHLKGKWKNTTDGVLHAFHSKNWGNMQYQIKDMDFENNKIMLGEGGWQCQRRTGPGSAKGTSSPYYIENIFEELDTEYEWFHDTRTHTLYFKTPKEIHPSKALIEAASTTHIIECIDTKNIHFENITFSQSHTTYMNPDNYTDLARGDWAISRSGAIYFLNSENCSIKNCHINQVGSNGIFVNGKNKNIRITGCLIEEIGESGVCFVGDTAAVREYQTWENKKPIEKFTDLAKGPKTDDYPKECAVTNSIIRDVGIYGKQTSGVLVSMSMDITIGHCSIYRIPRAAVTFNDGTWGGHIMEHCDIWDAVTETGEHGPFNSWGRERFWHLRGLKKEYVLLDAMKAVHLRNNRVGNYRTGISAGNWTIDLDDGSSNFHIYNNLMLGSTLKLRDGYFRKVYNNIIVSAIPLGIHVWPEDNSNDELYKNIIVVGGTGSSHGHSKTYTSMMRPIKVPREFAKWGTFDRNLWWNGNSTSTDICAEIPFAEWQKKQGENSAFGKPLFEDPANFNYQVKSNSPALALGFKNFAMDDFGHQMTTIVASEREFITSKKVEIKADARGGEVHYTLDGSVPTTSSQLYKTPFIVNQSTTVRALTFDTKGNAIGFEDKATFTKVKEIKHQSWLANLLGEESTATNVIAHKKQKAESFEWKGMTLVTISDFPDYIDGSGGQNYGVFVEKIAPSSKAASYGFKNGDTIIGLKTKKVVELNDLKLGLESIKKTQKEAFACKVFRNYKTIDITIPSP